MALSPKTKPIAVTAKILADIFGLDDARVIRKLSADGYVHRVGRDQYDLISSTRDTMSYYRKIAAGRTGNDPSADNLHEGALLKRATRQVAEMKRDQLDGKLIDIPSVKEAWVVVMTEIRQICLGWPNRAQLEIPHLTGDDVERLKSMTHELLKADSIRSVGEAGPRPERSIEANEPEG